MVRIENREGPKGNSSNLYRITLCRPVGPNSTPVGPESTGVGPQPTGGVGPESTRTSHSFEPVTEPVEQTVADAPSAKKKAPKFDPLTACPTNVTPSVWADWCQHRREIRKPLTKTSCERQAAQLAKHHAPDAVINQSISNGWTGLFPEKVLPGAQQGQRRSGPDFNDTTWADDLGAL